MTPADVDALLSSESLSRALVARLPGSGILLLDRELRIVLFEGDVFRAADWSSEGVEGKLLADVLPAPAWERLGPEYRAALGGQVRTFEYPGAGGRTYRVVASPVASDGGPGGVFVMVAELADRDEERARLHDTEALLRSAFHAAPVAIGLFSLKDEDFGRLLEVNRAGCDFFGLDRDALLATRWQDLTPGDDVAAHEQVVRDLISSGGELTGVRKRYRGPDGRTVWGRLHMAFVAGQDGRPRVGLAQIEDITESVLREEALRRSEERFGVLFHQSPVAMALIDMRPDSEGTVVEANAAFGELVGRAPDELIGIDHVDYTHPEDRPSVPETRRAIRAGEDFTVLKRYQRPDGTMRIGRLHAVPVRDEDGEVRYGLGTVVDVTDQLRAERSREALIESAFDGIVAIDGEGCITVFNAAAERIFGYRAEDVLGKPMAQVLVPPESRERHLAGAAAMQAAPFDPDASVTRRVTGMTADGGRIPVEIIIRRTGHEPVELTAIVRDLSESSRAERRQREVEELFHSVFADSAVAMAVQNVDGRIVEVNDELCRFLGRERDELVGRDPVEFTHPDDVLSHDQLFETLIAEPGGLRREHRFVRGDGAIVWAFVHASLIRDERGRPRGIQKQLVDITAGHRTKARLAAVLDSLAEGVFALDAEGCVETMNPAAEVMLGLSESELLGRDMHEVIHAHTGPAEACPIGTVLRTGVPTRVEDDSFRRGDGTLLPVAYSASPLAAGDHRGVVVAFSDVSERKAREQALEQRLVAFDVLEQIRTAMREDRLVLYSQPIQHIATGENLQEELLLRMLGEDDRLVAPGDFLPIAEEYGLIADIDRWVIGQAAQLAARGRHVEVNVSGVTLGHRDLVYWVEEALAASGADPRLMTFEITETALTNDLEQACRFAEHVAELGCGFALDDFGTGYGSFTLLKRLPISYLKIDMEFVRTLRDDDADRHVVQAVVNLAQGLGMRTIAEGVEDQETLDILAGMGVDFAQGWLIGRPAPGAR